MKLCGVELRLVDMIQLLLSSILISGVLVVAKDTEEEMQQKQRALAKFAMMDLCQYVGVHYVKNPDSPLCSFIRCVDKAPIEASCSPGLRIPPGFMWGHSYPCTVRDTRLQCDVFKRYMIVLTESRRLENIRRLHKIRANKVRAQQEMSAARQWQMHQKHMAENPTEAAPTQSS